MGKGEDEQALSTLPSSLEIGGENAGSRCHRCGAIRKIVSVRCVVVVVVGVAVLLSAVFWLPPFFGRGRGAGDPDRDPLFRADIVAKFELEKPVSLLEANIAKLQYDILGEIGVMHSTVVVMSLEPLAALNWTSVVFGVWPYPKHSTISSAELSIIRSNFMALVTQQSTLHLTTSLFGNSFFFEVLKFPGGITIIPPQNAFLLQKVQMLFNFTLNFPIYEVQEKFGELKAQMKSGLLLNSYENLYVTLTNENGSTVAPPTVVQTSVVLTVGNQQPSLPRLRQLAQTIRSSSNGNLGLNHTVFGRVKQIRLSSFLKRSLNGGGNGISSPPSPAPQPHPEQHHNHHHHHHHHHHHSDVHLAPAPAPQHKHQSPPPSGCRFAFPIKPKSNKAHAVPAAAPVASPHNWPAPSPHPNEDPPVPAPAPNLPPSHPLPHVAFGHAQPPSDRVTDNKPPDRMPVISPSPFSSSVAGQPCVLWVLVPLLYPLALL